MKVVTAAEMRRIEDQAISGLKIAGELLMENAGAAVARAALAMVGPAGGRKVLIVSGKGNNGGDGYVAARHLASAGIPVSLAMVGDPGQISGYARTNYDIVINMGLPLSIIREATDLAQLSSLAAAADLVVDALLGTGVRGPVGGVTAEVIRIVNESGTPVLAVDLPSGVDADTGEVCGVAVKARQTVTFGFWKRGLLLYPGAEFAGEVRVADIGLPRRLAEDVPVWLASAENAAGCFPKRSPDTHKGTFGRVAVIGGSRGMIGAPVLAGRAALRAGAGLVALAVPAEIQQTAAGGLWEATTVPLPHGPLGTLAPGWSEKEMEPLTAADVWVVGPGLGRGREVNEALALLFKQARCPIVLDADGLNALATEPGLREKIKIPLVVTPHPGEMRRLAEAFGIPARNRLDDALALAKVLQAVVVLKGAHTVTASATGEAVVNPTGNPAMATGGMGDVLAGVIASLIGQGLDCFAAAWIGVYIHGWAGDLAAADRDRGVLAREVADLIPRAIAAVQQAVSL